MTRLASQKRIVATIRVLLLAAALAGCGSEDKEPCLDCPVSPRLKPADVVTNLQLAYRQRDATTYGKLLADDFTFWFDPASRPVGVPEFWNYLEDSTGTGNLLTATDIIDVRIALAFDSLDKPDPIANHVGWRKILVTDTFIEVDKQGYIAGGEPTTFRVDGDEQQFYFRKGRTPADTLASSATSKEWYLVEWHDLAHPSLSAGGANSAVSKASTWSNLKALYSH